MAFGTITLTINAVAKTFVNINQDNYSSEYRCIEPTEKWVLKISHRDDKPTKEGVVNQRHTVDLTHTKFGVPGISPTETERFYTVFVLPEGKFTQGSYLSNALSTWLTASSAANAIKVMNMES